MNKVGRPMGKLHQDDVRKKIQVSQLINILQNHALTGEGELAPTRMKSIEILLRKSMPDLTAVELSGDADNPLHMIQAININLKKPNES
jgi:hypothetical protein